MSPPDVLIEEKCKSKSRRWDDNKKISPRRKFKRDKLIKNSEMKYDSSSVQCGSKMVSSKRYTAQDRLKRLRANIELQKKIIDQVCSVTSENICDRNQNTHVLPDKSPQNDITVQKQTKNGFLSQVRYSADSRLKKIQVAFQKKIFNKKQNVPKPVKASTQENQLDLNNGLTSSNHEESAEKSNYTAQKLERRNSESHSSMDVDVDMDYLSENSPVTEDASPLRSASVGSLVTRELKTSHMTDEVCKFRHERAYLALHESFAPDFPMNLAAPAGDVFIVIDTNIFLSHLSFVKNLLICDIPPYKRPVIVIPWLVLQEIDYASKKSDTKLSSRAKSANVFIYNSLKKKHPRIFGQSLDDFKQCFKNAVCIDDYILQYCLKFISSENNVILLTDDINLCNKSMVNQVNVFTKKEFEFNFHVNGD